MMRRSRYAGTPNIGVYAAVNESLGFVACDAASEFIGDLEKALEIETIMTTVAGSYVVGSLVAMNSYGAVVSAFAEEQELDVIRRHIPAVTVRDLMSATGNNILVNDHGAIVNPGMGSKAMATVTDVLGVEAVKMTIGGCDTVGSVCCATNIGCVCTPDATDGEMELIADVLKVDVKRASVNHGVKYLGAGLLANSKGALMGDETTPIEMGKIEDGLNLF